jgi:hypothetical protein
LIVGGAFVASVLHVRQRQGRIARRLHPRTLAAWNDNS